MHISCKARLVTIIAVCAFLMLSLQNSGAQTAKPQQQQSERPPETIDSLVNEMAETLFTWAWPSATYEGWTYGYVRKLPDGYDLAVKLTGKGINNESGTDLWLMAAVSIRNGTLQNWRYAENNGLFPPRYYQQIVDAGVNVLAKWLGSINSDGGRSTATLDLPSSTPRDAPAPRPRARTAAPPDSRPLVFATKNDPGPGVTTGSELLAALDNSVWVADGADSSKQLYVLASPCDPYSSQFYAKSRQYITGVPVQIRWIEDVPAEQRDCRFVMGKIARQDPGTLQRMYMTGVPHEQVPQNLEDNAMRWNAGVENATRPLLRRMLDYNNGTIQYPVVFCVSRNGVVAWMRPKDLGEVFSSIAERPEAEHTIATSRSLMNATYNFEQGDKNKRALAKRDGVKLYSMPDSRSQVTSTLPKDAGYPIASKVKVNGESWLELQCAPDPVIPNLFVRESDVDKVK